MRIGIISDTHGYLAGKVFDLFCDVQYILHAGDIGDDRVLTELETLAPVFAVSGNMDGTPTKHRPITFSRELGGIRICMTHGHLLNPGCYSESAIRMFSDEEPRVIVHGHSHRAKHETLGEVSIINPGAACRPRFQEIPSVAVLEIAPNGELVFKFHRL